jgi:hypothetical protein
MEVLSEHAAIAGSNERAVSLRLFLNAPERQSATKQVTHLVLRAMRVCKISHDPESAVVLALDPMNEFERDFPAPE